jgi:hypothetical protein
MRCAQSLSSSTFGHEPLSFKLAAAEEDARPQAGPQAGARRRLGGVSGAQEERGGRPGGGVVMRYLYALL